jgi:hypothetical protein
VPHKAPPVSTEADLVPAEADQGSIEEQLTAAEAELVPAETWLEAADAPLMPTTTRPADTARMRAPLAVTEDSGPVLPSEQEAGATAVYAEVVREAAEAPPMSAVEAVAETRTQGRPEASKDTTSILRNEAQAARWRGMQSQQPRKAHLRSTEQPKNS